MQRAIRALRLHYSRRSLVVRRSETAPIPVSAAEAAQLVKSGDRIYVHSVAAFP
jgi:hypothetical protein